MPLLPRQYAGFSCLVSAPPSQGRSQAAWPILVFLHGRDEAAPLKISLALTRHGPLRADALAAGSRDFLVVAPQLPSPGGDVWAGQTAAVQKIAAMTAHEFMGDPARVYLTGFSFGGNGALDIGVRPPLVWAAIWAVDPTRVPMSGSQRPVWISGGRYAHPQRDNFGARLGLAELTGPAEGDFVYHYVDPGHSAAATAAYGSARTYAWLRQRRLP